LDVRKNKDRDKDKEGKNSGRGGPEFIEGKAPNPTNTLLTASNPHGRN